MYFGQNKIFANLLITKLNLYPNKKLIKKVYWIIKI